MTLNHVTLNHVTFIIEHMTLNLNRKHVTVNLNTHPPPVTLMTT